MAKRFMFVSAGILMLALAYHFGASSAQGQAQIPQYVSQGNVVAVGSDLFVLYSNGWRLVAPADYPPVAASSLVGLFPGQVAITQNGEGWGSNGGWTNYGVPGGPTPVQPTTFGAIKAKFRK